MSWQHRKDNTSSLQSKWRKALKIEKQKKHYHHYHKMHTQVLGLIWENCHYCAEPEQVPIIFLYKCFGKGTLPWGNRTSVQKMHCFWCAKRFLFCFVVVCLCFVFVFHGGMLGTNYSHFYCGLPHNIGYGDFYLCHCICLQNTSDLGAFQISKIQSRDSELVWEQKT